jgi:MFS family permease
MDLVFPQILRRTGVKKIAGGAMIGAIVFLLILLTHTWWQGVILLVIGMAVWGIYYELDSFMTQQFVAGVAPRDQRSSVWGVVGVVRSGAYFLGPLIGAWVIQWGERTLVYTAMGILVIAYSCFLLFRLPKSHEDEVEWEDVHIKEEIIKWIILGKRVWPVLMMSLMGGLVDATFWTTGTVLTDNLAQRDSYGGWFLSAYMFPFLFVGLVVARWGIDEGKKRWSQIFQMISGIVLIAYWWIDKTWLLLFGATLVGVMMAASWPLIDSVYTDLVSRARKGKKHVMGMSAAMYGLAYIIGPIMSGYLVEWVGEVGSFAVVGVVVTCVSVILILMTPRKLALPQSEIKTWN